MFFDRKISENKREQQEVWEKNLFNVSDYHSARMLRLAYGELELKGEGTQNIR
jgi:hypothetical protein